MQIPLDESIFSPPKYGLTSRATWGADTLSIKQKHDRYQQLQIISWESDYSKGC